MERGLENVQQASIAKFRKIMILGSTSTVLLIVLFAYLVNVVFSASDTLSFDKGIIDWVQSFISDAMTVVMRVITEIGFIYVIFPIMLVTLYILLFKKKHYWEAVMLIGALGGGDLIKVTIKNILQRARPEFHQLVQEGGYSFPSGHTMASITFYGMFAYIIWLNSPHRKGLRTTVAIVAPLIILLVGVSRIYLGVHYPTDVVAGYAIGGAWLITCIMALNAIRYYKSDKRKQHSLQK